MITNKALNDIRHHLLTEIMPKLKYDKLLNSFVIKFEDYMYLSKAQKAELEKMCKDNNIVLEQFPTQNTSKENQALLQEYNKIKSKLKAGHSKDLEEQLFEVRNKILLGTMQYVIMILHKYMPDIKDMKDKEEIYQIGYEVLFELIDNYDETKNSTFAYFCKQYLAHHVTKQMLKENYSFKQHQIEDMSKVNNVKERYITNLKREATLEEISEELHYSVDKVKRILNLEHVMNQLNIDDTELTEEMIDDSFEETMIDKMIDETDYLVKLMDTLSPNQRTVLRLYYGFEDGNTYSYDEIAEKIGNVSRERVRQIKEQSLEILTNSIRGNYLSDIHGVSPYPEYRKSSTKSSYISERILEDLLIEQLEEEQLISIINHFNQQNNQIITLYYGLNGEEKHDFHEIANILGMRKNKVVEARNEMVQLIMKAVVRQMAPNYTQDPLAFLLNRYLNKPNNSKKKH